MDNLEIEMVFVEGNTSLPSFSIGKYQVTQAQWKAVMEDNPSCFKGNDLPVESVSWDDTQDFIKKLNEKTGKKYRLPTEAEWEYAARGGNKSEEYIYAGSDNIDEVAWYDQNSESKTQLVGKKKPNELGLYDMSGNVWEWCEDLYNKETPFRVLRGGSWYFYARLCRVTYRGYIEPQYRNRSFGLRLAL